MGGRLPRAIWSALQTVDSRVYESLGKRSPGQKWRVSVGRHAELDGEDDNQNNSNETAKRKSAVRDDGDMFCSRVGRSVISSVESCSSGWDQGPLLCWGEGSYISQLGGRG